MVRRSETRLAGGVDALSFRDGLSNLGRR